MKYQILTEETKSHNGITLYRIQAVSNFSDVKAGDKGGWIEKKSNLSHEGDAWIYDNAMVYDYARVYGNARIYGNARVYGDAIVRGDAKISGNAIIYGNIEVS